MTIKGILFDKDGTLIDFQSIWLSAAYEVVELLVQINQLENSDEMKERILRGMGVENAAVLPDGPLAYQTYEQIGSSIAKELQLVHVTLDEKLLGDQMSVLFESVIARGELTYQPITDIRTLFHTLKKMNVKLGLATADTKSSVKRCFEELDIMHLFDFLGWDDGVMKPKPETEMFDLFCQQNGLQSTEVLVVGDTVNDMKFARKCNGVAVGVLSGLAQKADFEGKADYIVDSIEQLPALIDGLQRSHTLTDTTGIQDNNTLKMLVNS